MSRLYPKDQATDGATLKESLHTLTNKLSTYDVAFHQLENQVHKIVRCIKDGHQAEPEEMRVEEEESEGASVDIAEESNRKMKERKAKNPLEEGETSVAVEGEESKRKTQKRKAQKEHEKEKKTKKKPKVKEPEEPQREDFECFLCTKFFKSEKKFVSHLEKHQRQRDADATG